MVGARWGGKEGPGLVVTQISDIPWEKPAERAAAAAQLTDGRRAAHARGGPTPKHAADLTAEIEHGATDISLLLWAGHLVANIELNKVAKQNCPGQCQFSGKTAGDS